ncbi:MAG TPA: CbtB-domain containing protein [bacterium]|nr:CbtB-domain containing protein [bacterium]
MASSLISVATTPVRPLAATRLLSCALAALLGLVLLYGVGLAQPAAVHNAAHDARHAIGFPCH